MAVVAASRTPRQGRGGRRPGIVYGINIFDPDIALVRLDYVGQTRQRLRSRVGQHREDQPFSDLIVGDAFVIAEGRWTNAELDEVELRAIRRLRPRYNYDGNLDNPDRIPIWLAREQRAARDAARGAPAWVPPKQRDARPPRAATALPRRLPVGLPRSKRLRTAMLLFVLWLVVAGGLWWAVADAVPTREGAMLGAGGASSVFLGGWLSKRPRRRRRRRR